MVMIWDISKNAMFEYDEPLYLECRQMIDHIVGMASKEIKPNKEFTKDDISLIIDNIFNAMDLIRSVGNSNIDYSTSADNFISKALNVSIEALYDLRDLLYDKSNIEAIQYVNNESVEYIPLNEFKVFKFHNLNT